MAQLHITLESEFLRKLFTTDNRDDAFSRLLETSLNQVLVAQSTEQLGAEPYERSEEPTAYRNGFRDRKLTTRIGTLTLRAPDIAMATSAQPCSNVANEANRHWCRQ